ncbi:head GIN domain-containing protein [Maribacter sp. 2307ULW6-5]|uniref:head GIN domain-containing protein n=1 Tax=Maribacter sp. 2307ULW6-5 TaxID=3386275 RepID=UPI0039BD2008
MKFALSHLLLFFVLPAMAQRTIDRAVGEFNEVKVYDLIEVNLIQSNENKILIKGRNTGDIKWTNKNGVLKLRMQLDRKFTGEDTFIEVHYTDLDIIDANEGARVTCNEMVKKSMLTLRAQEGAQITMAMDVKTAHIRAVTGGIVTASGLVDQQTVVLNTGGIFEGRDLRSNIADVKVSAGGEAEVFASELMDVHIKAGGDVMVYGRPKELNERIFVGGTIRIAD